MRARAILGFPPALLLAASVPAQPAAPPSDPALTAAKAELAAAELEAEALQRRVGQAKGIAARLAARQIAAGQEIEEAEARITAAEIEARLAAAAAADQRRRLTIEQRPVAALLGGLAIMAQRPPLLVLADNRGADELVRVKLLLDSTLPAIRRKTAALRDGLERSEQLRVAAVAARSRLARSRTALISRRVEFAKLEQRSLAQALEVQGQELGASDSAIAAGERVTQIESVVSNGVSIRHIAAGFAASDPAPQRPFAGARALASPSFSYRLPSAAPVSEGLGAISDSGVRSRGLSLATARGTPLIAPAGGIVRFAGPYRDYDGVVIIDHGRGWISVIVNLATSLRKDDRVESGGSIGRALGPILLELSHNGQRRSPAIIAGSSPPLSNAGEGG